jgi:hypothetical protein
MTATQLQGNKKNPNYHNQWAVTSESTPNKEYKVSQKPDGSFSCSCPAWKFKHAPRPDCKHIIGIKTSETKIDHDALKEYKRKIKITPAMAAATPEEPVFLLQTRRKIVLRD